MDNIKLSHDIFSKWFDDILDIAELQKIDYRYLGDVHNDILNKLSEYHMGLHLLNFHGRMFTIVNHEKYIWYLLKL